MCEEDCGLVLSLAFGLRLVHSQLVALWCQPRVLGFPSLPEALPSDEVAWGGLGSGDLGPRVETVLPQAVLKNCFLFLPEEKVFVFPGCELLCVRFPAGRALWPRPLSSLFLKDFIEALRQGGAFGACFAVLRT